MLKRLLTMILLGGLFLFLTAGVYGNEPVQITVFTWDSVDPGSPHYKAIERFKELHPEIEVKAERPVQGEDYYDKLVIMEASGMSPDVFQIGEAFLAPWAARGMLRPLDPFIERDPEMDLEEFFPGVIYAFQYKGRTYILPKDFVPFALYYNKDIFGRYGVAEPDDTWTWNDLLSAAQTLTKGDPQGEIDTYGCTVPRGWETFMYVWMNGGEYITEDRRVVIDQPAATDAIQWWADLMNVRNVAPPPDVSGYGFSTGNVGMAIGSTLSVPGLKESTLDWCVEHVPKGSHGRASILLSSGFGISNQTTGPEAAWEFVKYITREGAEVLAETGFSIPACASIATKPGVYLRPELEKYNLKVFIEAADHARLHKITPSWRDQWNILSSAVDPVWKGERDAKSAMKVAAEQIRTLLKEEQF